MIGAIVLAESRFFLVIKDLGGGDVLGLTIKDHFSGTPWEWALRQDDTIGDRPLSEGMAVWVSHPQVLSTATLTLKGKVNDQFFDKILRSFTKHAAATHFDSIKKKGTSALPPSGKVLGREELDGMIDASLDGWLTTGRFNDVFERDLASFLGVRHALTVNSGSSANLLAVSALTSPRLGDQRLLPGDEIITVAAGFPTTVAPIVQNGLVPVFVDVEIGTYNLNVRQLEESLTAKTKAIFLAHTLGNPFPVEEVALIARERRLWLIEDNCDALGARVGGRLTGTFGHIATCSFYPAHHITMGEGGAVLTNDLKLNKILLSLRDWGRDCWCPPGKDNTCRRRFDQSHGRLPEGYDHKYVYSHLGYNLKITDWQAAVGGAQLAKLPGFIAKRRENFNHLHHSLSDLSDKLELPRETKGSEASWFGFPITVKEGVNKGSLVKSLEERGIGTRHLFAGNMLRQPAFVERDIPLRIRSSGLLGSAGLGENEYALLPNTDRVMKGTFWVGVWPGLNTGDMDRISAGIHAFFPA